MIAALIAAVAWSSVVVAAPSLNFGDAPDGWSVISGEASGKVGKIQATGLKKSRIRYSLVAPDGFSISRKSGAVRYDGSELPADAAEALLIVTATDRKGKADPVSVAITVSVVHVAEVVAGVAAVAEVMAQFTAPPPHPWTVDCGSKTSYVPDGVSLIYYRTIDPDTRSSLKVEVGAVEWSGGLTRHNMERVRSSSSLHTTQELAYAIDWWTECAVRDPVPAAAIEMIQVCERVGGPCSVKTVPKPGT